MPRIPKFKQYVALFFFSLSCAVSLVAVCAIIVLFFSNKEPDCPLALTPLMVEPALLDFQEVEEGQYEKDVYLTNRSNREITLLFAKSSCSCGVLKLTGDSISPKEKIAVKCTLSTVGRSGTVSGVILIAYHFFDDDEDTSPMYALVKLRASVLNQTKVERAE